MVYIISVLFISIASLQTTMVYIITVSSLIALPPYKLLRVYIITVSSLIALPRYKLLRVYIITVSSLIALPRYKLLIIIYHDFLPTPRRGSHVKSGKTDTQSSRYTPLPIYLTAES